MSGTIRFSLLGRLLGTGYKLALHVVALLVAVGAFAQAPRVIDDFESVAAWSAHPSDGVELKISEAPGLHGKAMRLDFDFHQHAGYAIARRNVDLDLPANYVFNFSIAANAPVNDLEFKLIDASGDNVFWMNRRNFTYPQEWTELSTRKRQISFAWGPQGGGELRHVAAVEIVITAGSGGAGSVLVDDFTLTELPPAVIGPVQSPSWKSNDGLQRRLIDLGVRRELGGLRIEWDPLDYARDFAVELSKDGEKFTTVREVRGNQSVVELLHLPDQEARFVRLTMNRSARGQGYAMRALEVEPVDWAPTANDFVALLAKEAPRGSYPRYFSREQSYWTVVGADGGEEEALVSEDGAVEPFKGGFSIEPFLYDEGSSTLITWADVTTEHSLMENDLPIPSVQWRKNDLTLTTTVSATADSMLLVRYRLQRDAAAGTMPEKSAKLFLALRPYQVNPSTQFLNLVGGVSSLQQLSFDERGATVNGQQRVWSVTPAKRYGAASGDEGNIVDFLRRGEPGLAAAERRDANGTLSGAFEYDVSLAPGQSRDIWLAVPLEGGQRAPVADPDAGLRQVTEAWREKLHRVTLDIPGAPEIADTVRTSLAYMLVHRDGPSLEPGTRSYDRAWIRDGALMGALLIRFGHADVAREFATWFAKYQFDDGKVPCCVDRRGADPVPENDSHGELIYLVAELYRYTHDTELVRTLWPNVDAAARYIEKLRSENHGQFEGLVTESISHEGYSANPMHSYWDDFFALKGVDDAAFLAGVLGLKERRSELLAQGADFRSDLLASIRRTIEEHHIDYIPGAAELGDFDATSTAIGISPLGMTSLLPERELRHTFERYLQSLEQPRADYTPYEMRIIGAMVRLGEQGHVERLVARFLRDRRPKEWNEWGEVVATDLRRPIFVGDMPHAWVASDFVRSIVDAIAFDREDGALIVGAGVPRSWFDSAPLHAGPLPTYSGTIDVKMRRKGERVEVDLSGTAKPARLILHSPDERNIRTVRVNGRAVKHSAHEVTVPRLPAKVVFTY
jgi:hypothetical protein